MDLWYRLPWVARTVVVAVAWFSYGHTVVRLLDAFSADRIMIPLVLLCLMGAVGTAAADRGQRFGDPERFAQYREALRDGALPDGADPSQWRHWLMGSRLRALAVVAGIGPLLGFGLVSASRSTAPYHWVSATSFCMLAMGGVVAIAQRVSRINQLVVEVGLLSGVNPGGAASRRNRPSMARNEGRLRLLAAGTGPSTPVGRRPRRTAAGAWLPRVRGACAHPRATWPRRVRRSTRDSGG